MKTKHLFLSLALLFLAVALSGCAGGAGVASSWPGLSVRQDTAYVAYNTHIYAIGLPDGAEKWRFPTESNNRISFYADPALTPDGQQLIAGGYNNTLYSINPDSGQVNWEFAEAGNRYIASPLAVEEGIFAPSADNTLYALDLEGNLRWTFKTRGEIWAQPVTEPDCRCIYLTSMDHHVYSVNPENGDLVWQTQDLGGAIVGSPTLSEEGVLFVGTFGSEIIALDAEDGSVLWESPMNGWVWSGPALSGDRLFVGDLGGYFYALETSSGRKIWEVTPDRLNGPISAPPTIVEDTVYFTTESGSVYSIDTEGNNLRTLHTFEDKLYSTPVPAGDMILVTPYQANGFLIALSEDGARLWSFPPPEEE